jgi:diacylglycerol O-acyltransferase
MGQPAGIDDERRMSDAEGLMWRLEADPTFASSFATVTLLDRPADMGRLRRRMARAVVLVPRLRQRVQDRPLGLAPVWVDVAEVDIDHHVRRVTLPAPGTIRQLLDMATELLVQPFDRDRPLWEFVAVDGLADGQGAFIQKMHHTVSDGENGIKLSLQFLDLERDGAEPPPLTTEELDAASPAPAPTSADALLEAIGNGVRLSTGAATQITELMLDPARLLEVGGTVRDRVRGTVSTLSDTEKAHSTLWDARSLDRHLEILQVPLEPVKAAAHALGGTLNVAFLTASAGAAGAYHRELGAPVETLRASMAISTRRKESGAGSNAFTLARLRVPTSEMDVTERFAAIHAAADVVRSSAAGGINLGSLAALAAALPTSLILRLARQQSGTIDFATSNLRAAPFPLYIAGARIMGNFPVGPLAGVAFNLTLLSYCGSLDMGLHLDPAAVAEPALLRSLLLDAFDELIDVTSRTPAQRPAQTPATTPRRSTSKATAKTPAKRTPSTAAKGARKTKAKGAAKQPAKAKRSKKAPAKSRARAKAS